MHLVLQRGEERLGHGVIVAVAGAAAGKTHVVGPRPLVDPLPQMLGVGKRLAADEPPSSGCCWPTRSRVVVRAALLRQGPLDAEDLEHLVYRGDVGELASAVRVKRFDVGQGPTVANAAFIRSESRRLPAECPMVSRLQRSTNRQT